MFDPNAAGKSNFLDALQLLSKLCISNTPKQANTSSECRLLQLELMVRR
jgi:AAA15 family ATPase/GTPase